MKIIIETIPHDEQRYPTFGDYWWDKDGTLQIRVSEVGDRDMEFLCARHELDEAWLAEKHGISELDIMQFDLDFEEELKEGLHGIDDEPGEDPRAPYNKEHMIADAAERTMAIHLKVNWQAFCDAASKLFRKEIKL